MINEFKTIIFDCDGVVLDSNKVKTEAFRSSAFPYGELAADMLVSYHVAHGGVSRYAKFSHFIDDIVPRAAPAVDGPGLEELLSAYAEAVRDGLQSCAVADGLDALRDAAADARWMIVSGGDQNELRDIFGQRGLDQMFDGGIFGSPDTKEHIIEREKKSGTITPPALFLGDSRYDMEVSKQAGLDFIFVSDWTEAEAWREMVAAAQVSQIGSLSDLLKIST